MGSSIGEMGRAVRMLVKSPGFAIFARCGIPQASPLKPVAGPTDPHVVPGFPQRTWAESDGRRVE